MFLHGAQATKKAKANSSNEEIIAWHKKRGGTKKCVGHEQKFSFSEKAKKILSFFKIERSKMIRTD